MFPALSSVQTDMVRFRRAYLRMARTVAFATFPLIIGLGATARIFIPTIYSDRWAPSVPILQILIVIGFFEAIAIWGAAAWALGNTRMSLICAVISLVALTIAFSVGVHWGLTGVAWAYVIASPIIFLLPHLWTNRLMGLRLGNFCRGDCPTAVRCRSDGHSHLAHGFRWHQVVRLQLGQSGGLHPFRCRHLCARHINHGCLLPTPTRCRFVADGAAPGRHRSAAARGTALRSKTKTRASRDNGFSRGDSATNGSLFDPDVVQQLGIWDANDLITSGECFFAAVETAMKPRSAKMVS